MSSRTPPVTGLDLSIDDEGGVWLRAADWSAEGHLWAIEKRPVSIATLRAVAQILGEDASGGVEARLTAALEHQRQIAATASAAVARAAAASERVAALELALDE